MPPTSVYGPFKQRAPFPRERKGRRRERATRETEICLKKAFARQRAAKCDSSIRGSISFPKRDIFADAGRHAETERRSSACHIVHEDLYLRGLEVASPSRRISIERFAGPPEGGRDECRRMCRPQGRRNLIHCPPFPSRSLLLSPSLSLLRVSLLLSFCLSLTLSRSVIYLYAAPLPLHHPWNPVVSLWINCADTRPSPSSPSYPIRGFN